MTDVDGLLEGVLDGDPRALARSISIVEDRTPGYRELVSSLYRRPGGATVIGVTGSPGVGKSTLVDAMVRTYRERGRTVGVIAVDPSSPFTGGALLGDRVRMSGATGDDDVFVRSMSARGTYGGVAAATVDAIRVLSVAGKDVVIVETVGAGQSEVDVASVADSIVVVVQPGSGDDVQALKAGLLEIGDVYVVNKSDRRGSDRAVRDLREMVDSAGDLGSHRVAADGPPVEWVPPVVETVATDGTGVSTLLMALDDHRTFLDEAGLGERKARRGLAEEIRAHLLADLEALVDDQIEASGGLDAMVDAVQAGETDPYSIADELLASATPTAASADAGDASGPDGVTDRSTWPTDRSADDDDRSTEDPDRSTDDVDASAPDDR